MTTLVVSEPAKEPVTVKEAKDYAKIDYTIEDSVVDILIRSSRKQIEAFTGMGLGFQTVISTITVQSYLKDYDLPLRPFSEIVAITYQPCRLTAAADVLTNNINWEVSNNKFAGEKGTYVIKYKTGLKEIPADLKTAILADVAYQYDKRGDGTLCEQAKKLIQPYKINVWGL